MSFKWSAYLELAFALDEQAKKETNVQKQEALRRCAISRAYYAVWCIARNLLKLEPNVDVARLREHGYVITYYQGSNDAARRQIGIDLQRMRGNRTKADYDDEVHRLDKVADEQIRLAQDTLMGLRQLYQKAGGSDSV